MRRRAIRARVRHFAIVTLKSGVTFRGVVYEWDETAVVLREAQLLEAGGDRVPQPVDGELLLLVAEVAYAQFV